MAAEAGLVGPAEERLRRALDLRRVAGDGGAIANATALLGSLLMSSLRVEAALAILEPAVTELLGPDGQADDPGRVALLAQLSRGTFLHEEHRRAVELADRALEAAERLDLVPTVSDLLITRGSALAMLSRGYEGIGAIRAGLELADQYGLLETALRGRINLAGFLNDVDPRAALETARSALTIARRLGRRGYARTLIANAAESALELGEWDWAVAEEEAARDEEVDEFGRLWFRWMLTTFRAWRGEDLATEQAELVAWAESLGESGALDAIHGLRAELAFGARRFREACDEWMLQGPTDGMNAARAYAGAGVSALLDGDAGRTRAALAAHETTGRHGRLPDLDRRLLGAGLTSLDGRSAEALREFRDVLAGYRELGLPWRLALGALVMASTLDPDEPDVRAAAEEAREIFGRLGAAPFVEHLESLMSRRVEVGDRDIRTAARDVAREEVRLTHQS
jgi:hypothetical protein